MLEKALNNIRIKEIVNLTQELVQFQTINPPGDYCGISKFIENKYKEIQLDTYIIEGERGKPNVLGVLWGQKNGETLMLSGHMDVVDPGNLDKWNYPPFQGVIKDNKIWGRGTADMKAAIAAQIVAVKEIINAGIKPKGNLILGATVDDEIAGDKGMKYLIEKGFDKFNITKPDKIVLGEPTNLDIVGAFKGRVWGRVLVKGKAAHGGAPFNGINAIEKTILLINQIRKMEITRDPLLGEDTINIGIISGGDKINVVPEYCKFTFDIRMGRNSSAEKVIKNLKSIIRQLGLRDKNFEIGEIEISEKRNPVSIEDNHNLVNVAKEVINNFYQTNSIYKGALSSGDLYHALIKDIPGIWLGPGEIDVIHSPNEYVDIEKLHLSAKIYCSIINELLN